MRLETALASRSNRSFSSALSERCWGRILRATFLLGQLYSALNEPPSPHLCQNRPLNTQCEKEPVLVNRGRSWSLWEGKGLGRLVHRFYPFYSIGQLGRIATASPVSLRMCSCLWRTYLYRASSSTGWICPSSITTASSTITVRAVLPGAE